MTTERDPGTRIVLSWLREDAHENAERVLLRAFDEIDMTRQRRSGWPAWRSLDPNPTFKYGLAAAAVLVVAIVGYTLLPPTDLPGASQPPATPTAAPTATPTARPTPAPTATPVPSDWVPLWEGPLTPGTTYYTNPFGPPNITMRIAFIVPDGWLGAPPGAVTPTTGTAGPNGAAVAVMRPRSLYRDPCMSHGLGSPALSTGETVDDLVDALVEISSGAEPPYVATTPEATVVSGYSGVRLDLLLPSDVDFATCSEGTFWVWDVAPYAQGPGNRWHLWILDVEGTRLVVFAQDFEATPPKVKDDIEAIVNTLRIGP